MFHEGLVALWRRLSWSTDHVCRKLGRHSVARQRHSRAQLMECLIHTQINLCFIMKSHSWQNRITEITNLYKMFCDISKRILTFEWGNNFAMLVPLTERLFIQLMFINMWLANQSKRNQCFDDYAISPLFFSYHVNFRFWTNIIVFGLKLSCETKTFCFIKGRVQ